MNLIKRQSQTNFLLLPLNTIALSPSSHDNIPVSKSHIQVQAFLSGVLGIVEGELVELFEFHGVHNLLLQAGNFLF